MPQAGSGSWSMACWSTAMWSAAVLAPALPGRRVPARASRLSSRWQTSGWKPKPPLKLPAAPSFSERAVTSVASKSRVIRSGQSGERHLNRAQSHTCTCILSLSN